MSVKKARVVAHERTTASLLQALRAEGYEATAGTDQHTAKTSSTSISVSDPTSVVEVVSQDGTPTSVEAHGQGSRGALGRLAATISHWRKGG